MEGGGGEGEDRISQLPDPILQHILSFIDINQALQTTILSTRWKNLYFSLASVSLKNRQSARAFSLILPLRLSLSLSSRRVLRHTQLPPLLRQLSTRRGRRIRGKVRELRHLHAFCHQTLRLPAAFYSCKSLRELKLTHFSHHGIYLPKGLSFPNLKTLYLEKSAFLYDDVHGYSYRNEPFSSFPELEKLILRQSIQVDRLVISAPKLRFLEIIHDRLYSQVIQEISAPLPP